MIMVLARHGKTFEPHETPRYIGAGEDIPLTAEGLAQADKLRDALSASGHRLTHIESSALQRTRCFAEATRPAWAKDAVPAITLALTEIDYGAWANKSRAQVAANFGEQALSDWDQRGIFPEQAGFEPPASILRERLSAWLVTQRREATPTRCTLAVTHGGVLRMLSTLITPGGPSRSMACGHIAVCAFDAGAVRVLAWDVAPSGAALGALFAGHTSPNLLG